MNERLAKRLRPWLLGIGLSLISAPCMAHEDDDPLGDHRHGSHLRPESKQTSRYGSFELRFGPYRPRVDSEFSGATPFADAFGTKPSFSVGLEADWQALRIPFVGSLGPGLGVHWYNRKSLAPLASTGEESGHPDRLWVVPTYLAAVLRIDVLKRRFSVPVVPYVKGGFAVNIWEARDARRVSEFNGVKARGIETGLSLHLGLMLHLNPLSPQAARNLDASSGVNDAYLFGEWWMSDVDSFNTGMQVGTNTWTAGLAIEY